MLSTFLKEICRSFFDIIYPPVCPACGKEQQNPDEKICPECLQTLCMFEEPLCPTCGAPILPKEQEKKICRFCPPEIRYFDQVHSLYSYKDERVKNLVHSLKFAFQTRLAETLSELLFAGFTKYYPDRTFDFLVPVPLHKSRLREREFNQSTLLSETIAKKQSIPIREDLVLKIRKTKPQSSLDPKQRWKNLENAFAPVSESCATGYRILLIDDVMTTGATINAVSAVLRQEGARSIHALTFARAIGDIRIPAIFK